jgi:diguanylate cyclase (GGDEF)-like protein
MPDRESPKVLIIDDDLTVGLLAKESLQQAKFRVTVVQTAAQMRETLPRLKPAIILLDVQLPDGSGIQLCSELRQNPAHADTPILMITGADDPDSILAAYAAGATDFMPKPLNWYLLVQRVRYMWRSSQVLGQAKESERLLAQAQMMAMVGNWEKNFATGLVTTSEQFRHLFGNPEWSRTDSFLPFLDAIPALEQPLVLQIMNQVSTSGQGRTFDHHVTRANGGQRHVRHTLEIRRDQAGYPVSLCGTVQDITKDKRRSQLQNDRNHILERVLQNADIEEFHAGLETLLARQIPGSELRVATRAAEGWRCEHCSTPLARMNDGPECDLPPALVRDIATFLAVDPRRVLEFNLPDYPGFGGRHATLIVLPIQIGNEATPGTLICIFLPRGAARPEAPLFEEILQTISGISAITLENYRLSTELRYQAFHDNLTGLPNRFLFMDRLKQALHEAKRLSQKRALVYMDLDRFKHTNDLLGHTFGDKVLREVANRIKGVTRQADTLARMGGDEFMLISAPLNDYEEINAICERIREVMTQPFELDNYSVNLGVSLGVSLYPIDGEDPVTLHQNADIAIYHAKKRGGNVVKYYDRAIMNLFLEKLELENDMPRALDEGEFSLVFQPQFRTDTGRATGYEALLRWRRDDGTVVPPSVFIPIAEENGFIVRLGIWVLERACALFRDLHRAGHTDVKLAVNVSTVQFVQENFPDQVQQVLDATGFPARHLELEVTESAVMHDIDIVAARLNQLRSMGATIAIDDFGTGYSSISYLKSLPIDCLKIDRSFVMAIGPDQDGHQKSAALMDALINLAGNLDLTIVAEGVEDKFQLDFLRRKRCTYVQGYYTGKPAPFDQLRPDEPGFTLDD